MNIDWGVHKLIVSWKVYIHILLRRVNENSLLWTFPKIGRSLFKDGSLLQLSAFDGAMSKAGVSPSSRRRRKRAHARKSNPHSHMTKSSVFEPVIFPFTWTFLRQSYCYFHYSLLFLIPWKMSFNSSSLAEIAKAIEKWWSIFFTNCRKIFERSSCIWNYSGLFKVRMRWCGRWSCWVRRWIV